MTDKSQWDSIGTWQERLFAHYESNKTTRYLQLGDFGYTMDTFWINAILIVPVTFKAAVFVS